MPEIGERAPDFSLKSHTGNQVSLADFRGHKKVMIVFYYLSWTPV